MLSLLAAGFLVRTFIVFHDCAHGSFLPSKRANAVLGAALAHDHPVVAGVQLGVFQTLAALAQILDGGFGRDSLEEGIDGVAAAVLTGLEDLNNNYLPGVNQLVDQGKVSTFYKKAPYMLSANTAWLEPNTTHKPLNDPVFRRALAESININQIVTQDYQNLVLPASPTGLLPTWSTYVDKNAVAENGFKYSPTNAVKLLTDAGYKRDSSGMFMNKDGSKIDLQIAVPQGWSDWEAARDMIISSAKAAGIRITAKVKDFNTWQSDRNTGNFDLVVDNNYQISDNPWTYWNGIFHLPILTTGTGQTNFNYERYSNPTAWALVQKLDKTPLSNTAAIKELNSSLQTTLMKDLPLIPLWYNGQWAQFTSKYWTNWPASGTSRQYTPVMWGGYLQMTGIDMFTHLKPVK